VAFQRYASADGGRELSLDVPWRVPGAPNGVDERLIVDVVQWAAEGRASSVSLAFAAFPDLFSTEDRGVLQQTAYRAVRLLDRFIKLESLYRFVRKFHAFGLALLVLAYSLGPISGCHINPAVTMGFLVSGRMSLDEALGYWGAQFVGGIVGAAGLFGVLQGTPSYSRSPVGLGADGYGSHSSVGLNAGGAFVVEIVLTFVFVFVILAVTRRAANALVAGLVIGLALTLVHLVGIPLDGTSVNPARSLGPALFVGSSALKQIWLFIIAPLIGGGIAAVGYDFLYPEGEEQATIEPAPEVQAS
jgi:aquaporin Z